MGSILCYNINMGNPGGAEEEERLRRYAPLIAVCLFVFIVTVVRVEAAKVDIHFFYGDGCTVCAKEHLLLAELKERYGEALEIHDYEIWYHPELKPLLFEMAAERGSRGRCRAGHFHWSAGVDWFRRGGGRRDDRHHRSYSHRGRPLRRRLPLPSCVCRSVGRSICAGIPWSGLP